MVPDRKLREEEELKKLQKCLKVSNLKRVLPAKCFQKNLPLSIVYGLIDMTLVAACYFTYKSLLPFIPFYVQLMAYLIYSFFAGFFMWAIFVVGHDCDHGSFSNSRFCNVFFGHFFHGAIMTPFFPWQRSHLKHHNFHNHATKDWSHPSRYETEPIGHIAFDDLPHLIKRIFPFIAWPTYITYGAPDGSHYIPLPSHRIYEKANTKEYLKCIFSALVNFAWMYMFVLYFGSFRQFAYFYTGPWLMFGFYLFTVTYMQHHTDDTVVFDDSTWNFERAGMETIDRKWGFPFDVLHHRITDCHVMHHLCHGSIPHYRLREATDALVKYLNAEGLGHYYRFEETYDWFPKIFSMMMNIPFNGKLKQV